MKRWLRVRQLWVLIAASLLLMLPFGLIGTEVLADTSAEVTVTAAGYVCAAPGGLTLTYISDYEVGISWTKGEGAENTMVRAAVGRLPESRTDGYLVYYGDGTSTSDFSNNLDVLDAPVYYRAWSQNAAGTWEDVGSSDFVAGVGVTVLAISIICLGLTIAGVIFKSAALYLLSTMGWVIFAFLMYGKVFDNAALNTALLMFGGAAALVCAVMTLGVFMSRRPPRVDKDLLEQERYRRQVLNATKRR